ncbi:unnamed protein product [Dovyalis caffra]|uniref:Heat shock factor binding protein 1 n=1 Tax=Dovyalis caffra TaxID=77055 RepID=A0AAV1REG3_9ROSI|nr:unnamed protein product [Dovyalis caffra]
MDGHDADDAKKSTADMTAFQSRFQTITGFLDCNALDEMGNRIDELEQSINDLRVEMGVEGSPSPSVPPKVKEESKSGNDSA